MENIEVFNEYLKYKFYKQLKAHHVLQPETGNYSPFPDNLHLELKKVLIEQGIHQLYTHQSEALESIGKGKDTLLVSRTASGKTLSFLLPILNDFASNDKNFSVMLLYPTKALSRDQEGTLGKLMKAISNSKKIGTFDGDTPREERERLVNSGDFIITNPDMLHSGILPNHNRKWKNFLTRLKYIVVDEVHMYRGAFGSHVSNVFRRLKRVCELHGSSPIFICSSATVGNPTEHVEALFRRKFHMIDKDGSPRPKRNLFFLNPEIYMNFNGDEYRKSTSSISVHLIRYAATNNLRSIVFCRARQEVERLYRSVVDEFKDLETKVKPYRGGLLPNERRKLEKDLFEGRLNVIISTNALELGIDIGNLDLCILSGHPGSIASFWQQAGRVGRKGNESTIVFIAKDSPIDQYIVNHPDFTISAPIEEAWLNAENPYILLQHLPCAAYEFPLRQNEEEYSFNVYNSAVNVLIEGNTLKPYRDSFRYNLEEYPAKGVNLRGMTDNNIAILHNGNVIAEIDPIGARDSLYKDAIYLHLGKRYMSANLDLEKKICEVEEIIVDYFTEAVWETMVTMTEVDETSKVNNAILNFGEVNINRQTKLYKKIKEKTKENIGYGSITLPPFIYNTTGFSMTPPPEWHDRMWEIDKKFIDAGLHGLGYIMKHSSPGLCMADTSDIHTDVSLMEVGNGEWESGLYLYDAHEGGVGYSEKIFEKYDEALKLCLEIIDECECEYGCPSCVTPEPPDIVETELDHFLKSSNASVECTRSLLIYLIEGRVEPPKIKYHPKKVVKIDIPEINEEQEKLNRRLKRAADILQKKREKIY